MRHRSTTAALAVLAIVLGSAPGPLVAQQPPAPAPAAAHDHSPAAMAMELAAARRRLSPELQKIKSLSGRWEGTTFREREGTSAAVVTYAVTSGGSAVIETLFPGTNREMTTVYHDDSSGRLVAHHYCNAANQPKLRLVDSTDGRLYFVLAPDADIRADLEGHAHELTLAFAADGSLTHDWLNHYLGEPGQQRSISLKKVP